MDVFSLITWKQSEASWVYIVHIKFQANRNYIVSSLTQKKNNNKIERERKEKKKDGRKREREEGQNHTEKKKAIGEVSMIPRLITRLRYLKLGKDTYRDRPELRIQK